ncbi:FBD-associated F-box protein At1g66310-like [Oryza glaberrima]|uniref:F-box domain-containing protein n=2 Tax=Oryza TaxID=4527 RepID=A0A0D3GB23_9ORYZ|nr:FBD-associated F-box protein At1g66310-like [Oryza glaberrima]
MGIFKLNLLLKLQRQRRRRRRQIQARNGSVLIHPRDKIKAPACQNNIHSLSGQAKCSDPTLPEDIWCHIHSLMSMRDAARVACVSRAFARSWRCLPNLDFSEESLGINRSTCKKDEKLGDLTSKIDWILKNHSGIGIKKLIVQVGSVYSRDSCHLAHLDSWLQCAVKPGIEELIVNLSSMNAKYNFPCELLSSGTGDSLRYIYLASCNFHPTVRIGCLKSLTRLQLCMVNITENELRCLLSISLGLERLELRHCSTLKCLKVPCLQRLSYLDVMTCTGLQVIESKAPNLSSIRFEGDFYVQLSLGEPLQIKQLYRLCNDAAFYARTELPSSMPNLERLIIHSDTEMVNTPMVPSKFYHLKYLSIALGGQTYDYLSLVSFFDASPFLETFILNALRERTERVTGFRDPSGLRMMPEHRHDKLKCVKIINFSSVKTLVELTCHIVESATALECLTLDTTSGSPRCSVNKLGKCFLMRRETLMEAHRALKAVQTYIKLKIPSKVELNVLEPCSRCHALDL